MPRKATFKLEGLRELEDALRELPEQVGKNVLWNAAMHGAEVVRQQVQQEVSSKGLVDEGILLENILKKRNKTDDIMKAEYKIGADSKRAFYDLFLELGTRKMTAKPFLLPALEASRQRAFDKVVEVLERRIALAAKKVARLRARAYF